MGGGITRKRHYRKDYRAMSPIYITRKNPTKCGKSRLIATRADTPIGHNGKSQHSPTFPSQNCHFPFDDHHQNLIRQYKATPEPPSPTASQSTQPFCKDAECGPTDRQTSRPRRVAMHCGALRKRCRRLAVHCGALRCTWCK